MKLTVEGTEKEIEALAFAIKEQQGATRLHLLREPYHSDYVLFVEKRNENETAKTIGKRL